MLFRVDRLFFFSTTALVLSTLSINVLAAGRTDRVNVSSAGLQSNALNGDYAAPGVSADGRYVSFSSSATKLVANDSNRVSDVFVHDRVSRKTERVSVSSTKAQSNKPSGEAGSSLSADGRYVAFASEATNLVGGDSNKASDIFVHDLTLHTTARVSVAANGAQANADSDGVPKLNLDGRYVAFVSSASNLVSGDTNGVDDVFVYDTVAHTIERVSVASGGAQANDVSGETGVNLSRDGRYIVFASNATNLVKGDTNNVTDVFVHDRVTHKTERVSVSAKGIQGSKESVLPNISADGRYVGFVSESSDWFAGDKNAASDVFVYDRTTHQMEAVSKSAKGALGNDSSGDTGLSFSASGRSVAFSSSASNLVVGDTNGTSDYFVHDRTTHKTERISVSSNGGEARSLAGNVAAPVLSVDGRYAVFSSFASNLVAGDSNNAWDIFVRDRLLETKRRSDVKIVVSKQIPSVIARNGEAVYQYVVTNNGPNPAADIGLVYLVSGGIPISLEPSQGRCSAPDGETLCRLGWLSSGRSLTLRIVVKALSHPLVQKLSVNDAAIDAIPANNSVSSSATVE